MGFRAYCRDALRVAAASGVAVALLFALALALAGDVSIGFNFDLGLARADALWILLLLPPAVVLSAILIAPLAWLLLRLGSALRRGP